MDDTKCKRLLVLFWSFCRISAVTLGGGMAMLPLMQQEYVKRRGWLTDEDMVDTVAAMQSMPGLIASNMGALIGYRVAGIAGAFSAVIGGMLPPFIVIAFLAQLAEKLRCYPAVQSAFLGVRSAIAALILLAVIDLARKIFTTQEKLKRAFNFIAVVAAFVALVFFEANAIWIIVAGGISGIILSLIAGRIAARRQEKTAAKE